MRNGGQIIIHDFMLNSNLTHPRFAALFSVHMLVYTKKGRVYSVKEYADWLTEAGFNNIKQHLLCRDSDNASKVLIAKKS